MRVIGSLYLPTCILAAVAAAHAFAPAKLSAPRAGKEAAWPPKTGVKTPGVQIPMASLKPEAEIGVDASVQTVFVAGQTAYVATASQLLPLNLKTNKAEVAVADIKQPCANLVEAFRSIWVPNCAESRLDRLDAKSGKVKASVPVEVASDTQMLVASSDSVWVLSDLKTTLSRIDPEQNKVVAEIRLPAGCRSLVYAENSLWTACPSQNKVLRINAATNVVSNYIEVTGQPSALAFGEATIWAHTKTDGKVVRIDPKTNKTGAAVELKTPGVPAELAFGEGFLWASSPGFPLMRIDPSIDKVVQQFAGDGGGSMYLGAGSIWALNLKANTVSRFDPKRIKATLAE